MRQSLIRRSLAVGDANLEVEFVSPTSEEVGHPLGGDPQIQS